MKFRSFPILFLLILVCLPAKALHIIGGDLSYECLGNDEYAFELIIYRDCGNPNGDLLDTRAPITIYLDQGNSYDLFFDGQIRLISKRNLDADVGDPCLQLPPNLCVEEGVYRFTATLPKASGSYHISYQRCCRNSSISNISRPSEQGATFTVEITPNAQNICNNGPTFNSFPPIAICAGEPLFFDHSASDLDGDSIVYQFCAPLNGAGTGGWLTPGSPTDCTGFRPNPSCAPPYNRLMFIQPDYLPTAPLGGNPVVTIDAKTGIIYGTPEQQGQFVVGVCAIEYRDGRAISMLRRDFQFNVTSCSPTVRARIQSDEVINDQLFIIKSCGEESIQFQNLSFSASNIQNLVWRFDLQGVQSDFSGWSPEIEFPGPGKYRGLLILNEGLICNDTAEILVNISPEIQPVFISEYDTCISGPVVFSDLTDSQGLEIEDTEWFLGDGNFSKEKNPVHLYKEPGDFSVSIRLEDENGCIWREHGQVSYFPAPAIIVIAPDDFVGCDPAEIFFDNLSFPIDDTYEIKWDFGDGSFGDEISPTNIFRESGIFDISVEIISPIGCRTDTVFNNLIEILPHPVAGFRFSPQHLNQFQKTVVFEDLSLNSNRWQWRFDSADFVSERNPSYTFRDTGIHLVRQIAIHPEGCRDTAYAEIDVIPEVRYYLPNAFSPNYDTKNDFFSGVGDFEAIRKFKMKIWNRWGETVFETNDPEELWNGKKNNVGQHVPTGVYVVVVEYLTSRGESVDIKGVVTVVR